MRLPWLVLGALLPARAWGQAPPPTDHPQSHQGLWVHYEGGASLLSAVSWSGGRTSLYATGMEHLVAVGGCVVPEFVIHGEAWVTVPMKVVLAPSSADVPVRAGARGVGMGLLWYGGLSEIFVGVSAGMAWAELGEVQGGEAESVSGIQIRTRLGKEWWVTDELGVGLALTGGEMAPFGAADPSRVWDQRPVRTLGLDLSVTGG